MGIAPGADDILDATQAGVGHTGRNPGGGPGGKPPAREFDIKPGKRDIPGRPMGMDDAIDAAPRGDDVLANSKRTARGIAEKAGDGPPIWHPAHRAGERPHYHPTKGGTRLDARISYWELLL